MNTTNNDVNALYQGDRNLGRHSFITEEEELEAIKKVEEELKVPRPRPCGWKVAIALYVRPVQIKNADGSVSLIHLPETVRADDKYKTCTGLVVAMGDAAYQDKKKFPTGPFCKVGDFVAFPRHAGHLVNYLGPIELDGINYREELLKEYPDGRPMMYVPDDSIFDVVRGPDDIELY